ncbi:MAG: SDR family NAD(P)-dependent oxidoreductase, partial [bacterium]
MIAASSADNLSVASKAVAAIGLQPLAITGDLRKLADCEQVLARVKERFGRCDILVNNAGATRPGKFIDLTDDVFLDGGHFARHLEFDWDNPVWRPWP